jgi:hypothetical protein
MALFENENILGERQGTFRRDRHIDEQGLSCLIFSRRYGQRLL